MKNMRFFRIVVVLGISLASVLRAAPPGLNILHSFKNGETQLNLATYTKATTTVGLLGISHSGHKVSYAFKSSEWENLRTFIQNTLALQPKNWIEAGSMAEIETTSPSHLLIFVNDTTIQFIISDPTRGTENFLLPRSDATNFLNQSAEVAKALKN